MSVLFFLSFLVSSLAAPSLSSMTSAGSSSTSSASLMNMEDAILLLSGASVIEELSAEEMEKYRRYVSSPLDINAAGISRLNSCGLFSGIQAASIIASRNRSGDILSWAELSLLDGFSAEYVDALKCFAVLRSSRAPGQRETLTPKHEIMIRGMMKAKPDDINLAGGLKYDFKLGERAGIGWATRNTYDNSGIGVGTVSAVWYGRKRIGKIVAGDIALRFGQGLAVWTGFSLSGLTTIQSYRRSPTGISQTSSFSSDHKGIGIDFVFYGRSSSSSRSSAMYSISAAYSISGKLPVLNVTRTSRISTVGLTATSSALATDFRAGLPSFSLFGEACWNFPDLLSGKSAFSTAKETGPVSGSSVSAVAGAIWVPEYGMKIGTVARYVDDCLQPAAGFESTFLKINFEGKIDYSKLTEMYKLTFTSGDSLKIQIGSSDALPDKAFQLKPSIRLSGKLKPQESVPFRADLRLDLDFAKGAASASVPMDSAERIWKIHWRADFEYSRAFSWQTYLEGGYLNKFFSLYVRTSLFQVDNWDDRIYVYERDLPGVFNCPALNGRGFNASLTGNLKFKHNVFSVRMATVNYFLEKPSSFEFKLQYSLTL